MPPVSEKQRRFIFAKAHEGAPWAAKFISDSPTMQVVKPGAKMPAPEPQYDSEKREIVKAALRKRLG